MMPVRSKTKRVYSQLVDDVFLSIKNGQLRQGNMLMSENELVRKYKISRSSVRKALNQLEAKSMISREPGRGTFVKWGVVSCQEQAGRIFNIYSDYDAMGAPWYYGRLFHGVHDFCSTHPCRLILRSTINQGTMDYDSMEAGVFVEKYEQDTLLFTRLKNRGAPIAFVNYDSPDPSVSCFLADSRAALSRLFKYLVDHGHRRVAGLFYTDNKASQERIAQLDSYFSDRGIHDCKNLNFGCISDWHKPDVIKRNQEGLCDFITKNDFSAIFLTVGGLVPLFSRAVDELGLQIPLDLSVVSYDDVETYYPVSFPELTCIRSPLYDLGKKAVFHVFQQLVTNKHEVVRQRVNSHLIIRESVRAVSR